MLYLGWSNGDFGSSARFQYRSKETSVSEGNSATAIHHNSILAVWECVCDVTRVVPFRWLASFLVLDLDRVPDVQRVEGLSGMIDGDVLLSCHGLLAIVGDLVPTVLKANFLDR